MFINMFLVGSLAISKYFIISTQKKHGVTVNIQHLASLIFLRQVQQAPVTQGGNLGGK